MITPAQNNIDEFGFNRILIQIGQSTISSIDVGTGAPVLLIHGAPMTSLAFCRVIRALQTKHRVIAPDLPGFGLTSVDDDFVPTMQNHADTILNFCKKLDLKNLTIFVFDSSGPIGLAAASNMIERVTALVIADTAPLPVPDFVCSVLTNVLNSKSVRTFNRNKNVLPWLVATLAPTYRPFSENERRVLMSQFATPRRRDLIIDWFLQLATDKEFLVKVKKDAFLKLGKVPTLVIYGQFDPMRFAGGVKCYRDMFPIGRTVILPLEEHFPITSSANKIAAEIEQFIDGMQMDSINEDTKG